MTELECIPFGTGYADEGVCLLLRMGAYRILCDCGVVDLPLQSIPPPPEAFPPLHPDWPADLVLCSHAHPDHARGLWALHETFPDLPIYLSSITAQLLPLNWKPSPTSAPPPPFGTTLPWRTPTEVAPGLTLELYPAGHLPGAAVCLLTYVSPDQPTRTYTALYTGDFLLSNARLVEGLPLADLRGLNPDVLILEGSFGTARHPHRRQQENQLAARIMQAIQQNMSVLIPVPVLGLAQELLMLMRSHHTFTGKAVDIWVEASLAEACDVYLALLPHLPESVQNFAQHQALFWDERVRPRVRRLPHPLTLQSLVHPCIVLLNEATPPAPAELRSHSPWLVLQPDYPPRESSLADRSKPQEQKVWEKLLPHKQARVETFLLADHCDGAGTTQLIHNLRPQHVIFLHGSPAYLADLIGLEELANRYHLHCPRAGNRLELPLGEGFIQTASLVDLDNSFLGEVNELEQDVGITLPPHIKVDPRWSSFADTGLIEATWQGDLLVIRGISQRELLMKPSRTAAATQTNLPMCLVCRHYRVQRCGNPASSLYGSKVAPEGYCPVFEPNDRPPSPGV